LRGLLAFLAWIKAASQKKEKVEQKENNFKFVRTWNGGLFTINGKKPEREREGRKER
jgi:hypothetical protein